MAADKETVGLSRVHIYESVPINNHYEETPKTW